MRVLHAKNMCREHLDFQYTAHSRTLLPDRLLQQRYFVFNVRRACADPDIPVQRIGMQCFAFVLCAAVFYLLTDTVGS